MVPDEKNFKNGSDKESQAGGKADRNVRRRMRFSRRNENRESDSSPNARQSGQFRGKDFRRERKPDTSKATGSKERSERPKGQPVIDKASIKPRRMADMEKGSKSILNITNLAVLAVLIGLVLFIIKIAAVFGIFLFSFVIAFLLFPMVEWLNSKHIPRVWAILIVYLLLGAILFGISAAVIPALITQASSLVRQIPEWIKNLQHAGSLHLANWKTFLQDAGIRQTDIENYLDRTIPTIQQWAMSLGQKIAVRMQGALGGIVSMFSVPIIVFYLLLDARRIRESLVKFAPKRTAIEVQYLLNRLAEMLNHYLRGQLKMSFIMFVLITFFLLLFGVKHALLIGVLGGFTEVIPIIGPTICLITALLDSYFTPCTNGVALLGGIESGLIRACIIFIFWMALQWVEGNILVPRIMGKNLNLHPLTVVFALLAGGYLAGIGGMLLALPIAACLKVVFEIYYPPFIERVEDLLRRRPLPDEHEN